MSSVRDYVKQTIDSDVVVIFSKSYCPYCKTAKQLFEQLNKPYKAIELDERADGDEIQQVLGEMTGAKTVPRIFVNGTCLGGCSDVKALHEKNELLKKFDS